MSNFFILLYHISVFFVLTEIMKYIALIFVVMTVGFIMLLDKIEVNEKYSAF